MQATQHFISGCRKGDPKSQSALFDLYKKKWMGVCVRYVKDIDEAQDVFQEAAIKIFKDIGKLKEVGAFDGWARRIIINQSLNHLKKKKVYVLMLQDYTGNKSEPEKADIEIIRRMDSAELIGLINSLPDGYRLVLNLALVDGYKHADIAKLLSISESTSRSQLNKARKSLQRLIRNHKLKENARIAG